MPSESSHTPTTTSRRLDAFQVDPTEYDGLTPADLTDEEIDRYRRGLRWREAHQFERTSVADPTFRDFLATTSHSPADPEHRRQKVEKTGPKHPLASLPNDALDFTLNCADGPLALNRAGVLALWTAKRNGYLPLAGLTRKKAQTIIDGGK